jgi:UDP-N-acetylmuramate dehydrogenase
MNRAASSLTIYENISLAPYTTLGVGGPARFLVKARNEDQVLDALEFARTRGCQVFVLGGGSNMFVSDAGFPGLVLKMELPGIQPMESAGGAGISAGAGVEWDAFVRYCVNRNLAGIECLSGIPGTVGGAPVQNVGAYGEEVSDVIVGIRVLDRNSDRILELGSPDCRFTYRASIFNTICPDRYIILRVYFALRPDGKPRIQYQDLQRRFMSSQIPTIGEVREAVLEIRRTKAMVLSDGDPDSKSVGSFFRNPVLAKEAVNRVEGEARAQGLLGSCENIPRFEEFQGKERLAAAWLIERAGFHKGYQFGRAGISSRHALAIINRGGATAQEILELMRSIQARVLALFGINLKPEPVFLGFE